MHPQSSLSDAEELVEMSFDDLEQTTNYKFLKQAAQRFSLNDNHSTIHLDGEKTINENNNF